MIILKDKKALNESWVPAKHIDALNYFTNAKNNTAKLIAFVGDPGCKLATKLYVKKITPGQVDLNGIDNWTSFNISFNFIASTFFRKNDTDGTISELRLIFRNKLVADFIFATY